MESQNFAKIKPTDIRCRAGFYVVVLIAIHPGLSTGPGS